MAQVPPGVAPDALHVAARGVLLDGLDALRSHLAAVVVVGAQAVYMRSADAPVAAAPFTADADLGLVPAVLDSTPRIEEAMRNAGFDDGSQPGIWTRTVRIDDRDVDMAVDLLVPERFGGAGRRGARIPPHGSRAARKVRGLEPATVDHDSS